MKRVYLEEETVGLSYEYLLEWLYARTHKRKKRDTQ